MGQKKVENDTKWGLHNLDFRQREANVIKGISMVGSPKNKRKAMYIGTKKRDPTNFEVALTIILSIFIIHP